MNPIITELDDETGEQEIVWPEGQEGIDLALEMAGVKPVGNEEPED